MDVRFKADFFTANRGRLTELFAGTAPIVLTAHGRLQSSMDETLPFRQDSNFWYLTGINEADIVLVIDKDKEYLILPEFYKHHVSWAGAAPIEKLREVSGIKDIFDYKPGWKLLTSRLKKVKHFATLAAAPKHIPAHGFYTNPSRAELLERIKSINPQLEPLDLKQHFLTMRIAKQPLEVEAIKSVTNITIKSFKALQRKGWTNYQSELHIGRELENQFLKNGAEAPGFDTVIGAGEHASIPHWRGDNNPIKTKGFLVLDAGAKRDYYSSDISRTYPLNTPTKRMRQVYEAVLAARQHALETLKPGVLLTEYETSVEQFIGEKLRELGLIKSLERKNIRAFFPHYTSHQLGLDLHDVHSEANVLQSGMVMTVEPGIYIPKEGLGVRIEDIIYVNGDKLEILTASLPIGLS